MDIFLWYTIFPDFLFCDMIATFVFPVTIFSSSARDRFPKNTFSAIIRLMLLNHKLFTALQTMEEYDSMQNVIIHECITNWIQNSIIVIVPSYSIFLLLMMSKLRVTSAMIFQYENFGWSVFLLLLTLTIEIWYNCKYTIVIIIVKLIFLYSNIYLKY